MTGNVEETAERLLFLWQKQWGLSATQAPFLPVFTCFSPKQMPFSQEDEVAEGPLGELSCSLGFSPRLGPRPLPYHLFNVLSMWSGLFPQLPFLEHISWHESLHEEWLAVKGKVENMPRNTLTEALYAAVQKKSAALIRGLIIYHDHPYRRVSDAKIAVCWQEGVTRLLDYGAPSFKAEKILIIPSLVNRSYILDLLPEASLVSFLKESGYHPFLLDWGTLSSQERDFSLTDYYEQRLLKAYYHVTQGGQIQPLVLGYCMGGILSMALAQRQNVRKLILLATPWDFHAVPPYRVRLYKQLSMLLTPVVERFGFLPADVIQTLVHLVYPESALAKFEALTMEHFASPRMKQFVALEDWVNDGVPLARKVALECLQEWFACNGLKKGCWRLSGAPLKAEEIPCPVLIVAGQKDRIVPPACTLVLKENIPHAEAIQFSMGHTGLIVSKKGREIVWPCLQAWLQKTL